MDDVPKKTITVIFTDRWYPPQSTYSKEDVFNVIQCDIPRNAPIHIGRCGPWWTQADSCTETDPASWDAYLCRTTRPGPPGWVNGLLQIPSGATFEDLERKYPDIAIYNDLAIHVKIPVTIDFNMLEIPSKGVRCPLPSKLPFATTEDAAFVHFRIMETIRHAGLKLGSCLDLELRINSSDTRVNEKVYPLYNTKSPIGQVLCAGPFGAQCAGPFGAQCAGPSGTQCAVDVIIKPIPIPPVPLWALSLSGTTAAEVDDVQDMSAEDIEAAIAQSKNGIEVLEATLVTIKAGAYAEQMIARIKTIAGNDVREAIQEATNAEAYLDQKIELIMEILAGADVDDLLKDLDLKG